MAVVVAAAGAVVVGAAGAAAGRGKAKESLHYTVSDAGPAALVEPFSPLAAFSRRKSRSIPSACALRSNVRAPAKMVMSCSGPYIRGSQEPACSRKRLFPSAPNLRQVRAHQTERESRFAPEKKGV